MTQYLPSSDRNSLLLERAEAAIYDNNSVEARRLLKAVLRSDPTNDQALLMLIYAAEDGEQSLRYLAQLLDVHPRHPDARHAIRWVQKRVPTSAFGRSAEYPSAGVVRTHGRSGRTVIGFALVVAALLVGLLWQLAKPPTIPAAPQVSRSGSDSITATPDLEPYIKIIKVVIPVFTPTPTATPTPMPTPTLVPSAWVPVAGHPQTYNLSCESRSAADLAGYWGVPIGELDFLDMLGLSDNPHSGFVGDVTMPPGSMPPYGYGVYAEPVASTLQGYGLDARPVYDLGLDALKAELAAGRPVMVWATYGMELFEPYEWTSRDGRASTVVPFMHTFIVTGFDETYIAVLDAYDATIQRYPYDTFLQAWSLFDQMAVTVSGPLQ